MIFNGSTLNGATLNGSALTNVTTSVSISAGTNASGSVSRRVGKVVVAVKTLASSLLWPATHLQALVAIGSLVPRFIRSRSMTVLATLAASMIWGRKIGMARLASATAGAARTSKVAKPLTAAVAGAALLSRRIGLTLAAASSLAGSLVKGGATLIVLAAAVAVTATVSRAYGKLVATSLSCLAGAARLIAVALSTVLYGSPVLKILHLRTINALLISLSSIQRAIGTTIFEGVALGPTGVLGVGKILLANLSSAPSYSRVLGKGILVLASLTGSAPKAILKAMAAALSGATSAAQMLLANRTLTASLSLTSTLVRSIRRTVFSAASVAASVSPVVTARRALSAGLGISIGIFRSFTKTMAPTITVSGASLKTIGKPLTAALGLTIIWCRGFKTTLTSGLSFAVGLATAKFHPVLAFTSTTAWSFLSMARGKTMTALSSLSVSLIRRITLPLTVAVGSLATIAKNAGLIRMASLSSTVSLGRVVSVLRSLSASATSSPSLTSLRQMARTLFGSSTLVGSLAAVKRYGLILTQTLSASASLLRTMSAKLLTGVGVASALGKTVGRCITALAISALTASRASALTYARALSALLSATVSRLLRIAKPLAGGLALTPTLTRLWPIRLAASLSLGALAASSYGLRSVVDLARRILAPSRRSPWRP